MGWIVVHLYNKKGHKIKFMENKKKNEIVLSAAQSLQVKLVDELDKTAEELGQEFTSYGKQCMINSISGVIALLREKNIDLKRVDTTILRLQIQNIGYTELNFATLPSEVYIDVRQNYKKDADGNDASTYTITIKPQGAGNEKLIRKYGVGILAGTGLHNAWLVREGDEFEYPYFDGIKMTPPKWKPKSYDKKVIMVVYPVEKVDGDVEYLIATREGIKPNLIAQIRQNTLHSFRKQNGRYEADDVEARNEFYERVNREFEELTVDEILKSPEWRKYLTPTYTSGGSVESMVLRKMKNNALKNYPKEYDNSAIRNAVEKMFEDNDESLKVKENENVIDAVENEINEAPNPEAPQDFKVDEDGVVNVEVKQEVVKEEKTQPKETNNEGQEDNPDW